MVNTPEDLRNSILQVNPNAIINNDLRGLRGICFRAANLPPIALHDVANCIQVIMQEKLGDSGHELDDLSEEFSDAYEQLFSTSIQSINYVTEVNSEGFLHCDVPDSTELDEVETVTVPEWVESYLGSVFHSQSSLPVIGYDLRRLATILGESETCAKESFLERFSDTDPNLAPCLIELLSESEQFFENPY